MRLDQKTWAHDFVYFFGHAALRCAVALGVICGAFELVILISDISGSGWLLPLAQANTELKGARGALAAVF